MTRPSRMFRFLRFGAVGLLVVGSGAAAIGIVAGPGASASTAGTASAVSLPSLSSLHQVLVDTSADKGAGYIFYSEGLCAGGLEQRDSLAKSGVIVTTLNGSYVKTLESGNGTEGIALSADGSTLYAATATGIAAISTDTLAIEDDVPLAARGGTLLPYDLAVQGGDLWISYLAENADGDTVGNGIGGLSLAAIAGSAGAALTPTQLSGPTWSAPPSLAADPQESGAMVAVEDGSSPPLVATYNADSATPDTPVATSTTAAVQFVNCSSARPRSCRAEPSSGCRATAPRPSTTWRSPGRGPPAGACRSASPTASASPRPPRAAETSPWARRSAAPATFRPLRSASTRRAVTC